MWSANVQRATIYVGGEPKRVKICTRCIRTQNKVLMRS